jgi:hypothetical protein
VPEPSTFEVELAIKKLKSHKSPGIDQIPSELIRIILRWILRKWEGVVGTGWSWLRIGTGGGRL